MRFTPKFVALLFLIAAPKVTHAATFDFLKSLFFGSKFEIHRDADIIYTHRIAIADFVVEGAIDYDPFQRSVLTFEFRKNHADRIYLARPDRHGKIKKGEKGAIIYEGLITRFPVLERSQVPAEVISRASCYLVHEDDAYLDDNDTLLIGIAEGTLVAQQEGRENVWISFIPKEIPKMSAVSHTTVRSPEYNFRILTFQQGGKSLIDPQELRARMQGPVARSPIESPTPFAISGIDSQNVTVMNSRNINTSGKIFESPIYQTWIVRHRVERQGIAINDSVLYVGPIAVVGPQLIRATFEEGKISFFKRPEDPDTFIFGKEQMLQGDMQIFSNSLTPIRLPDSLKLSRHGGDAYIYDLASKRNNCRTLLRSTTKESNEQ
jgi:hypothetical protein